MSFISSQESGATSEHPTFQHRVEDLKKRFPIMQDRMNFVFGDLNPELREVVDQRIVFLEDQFVLFCGQINPFHLQPGLLLDVDIVSIKRKSTTMMKMANVLNEFLYSISRGFADAAFASFSRRRSTTGAADEGDFVSSGGVSDILEKGEEVFG